MMNGKLFEEFDPHLGYIPEAESREQVNDRQEEFRKLDAALFLPWEMTILAFELCGDQRQQF